MAAQADRVYKRKRIKNPLDSGTYVEVPVLYQAKTVNAADQYQDVWHYFDNSSSSSRKVRVQTVTGSDGTSKVDCERIKSFFTISAAEQYQEHEWPLINNDPAPIQLDGSDNPAHQKKHVVRYFHNNDPSSGIYVDIELIDEARFILAAEQYQEYRVVLLNPDPGAPIDDSSVPYEVTWAICDQSFDLAPDETEIDPPYRLDPFQNIVNVNWERATSAPGGVTYRTNMGCSLPNPPGNRVDCAIDTVSGPPSGFITVFPLIGPPIETINGTFGGLPALTQNIGAPPGGESWTHFSSASSSGGTLTVHPESNLFSAGPAATFDFSGITFTADASGPFVGSQWIVESSSVSGNPGDPEMGQVCYLRKIA